MVFKKIFRRLTGEPPSALNSVGKKTLAVIRSLVDDFLAAHGDIQNWRGPPYAFTDEMKSASKDERVLVLLEVMHRLRFKYYKQHDHYLLSSLFTQLARTRLPLSEPHLTELLDGLINDGRKHVSPATLLSRTEDLIKEGGVLSPELRDRLQRLAACTSGILALPEEKRVSDRIKRILGVGEFSFKLDKAEPWAKHAAEFLSGQEPGRQAMWHALLEHASTATASKPSRKWLKTAGELIEPIGEREFSETLESWFLAVGETRSRWRFSLGFPDPTILDDRSSDLLRGLVWCLVDRAGEAHARLLGALADRCFQKVPQFGARCPKLGNACLYSLGRMDDDHAVAELSRLKAKFRAPSTRKAVDKALTAAAEKSGVSAEELEEMATPTFGFEADGVLRETIGDYTAELTVDGPNSTNLSWIKEGGRRIKSVPKAVKENHGDELKTLRTTAKDIQKMLPAVRHRLERLPLFERSWDHPIWCARYHDHPLVGPLSRRLIWAFHCDGESILAAWHDGEFQRSNGDSFKPAPGSTVRSWHPIDSSSDEIHAWREWLEAREITQPFKQAHREIYLLTDAERQTDTYSNRFAGHILKQHQVNALAQQRGWTTGIIGGFDSENTPTLELPHWGLTAQFWLDGVLEGADALTDAGIALYVATDQVRFYRGPDQVELANVPPLVFSEVMRDVDLFVGVASVGNDPNWADHGDARMRDYWNVYSWGDLSQSARTRRDVLERLLPRLKIAERCELGDKFLRVRGNVRTYKIHLGSGNIMMEPNNQYLCIVPGRAIARSSTVYLPFEGDHTLAIILSKAFMLADDRSIKDKTILSQLRQR